MEPHDDPTGAFVEGPRLLAAGRPGGALTGRTFAVKELIDVAGHVTGAGNPTRRATTPPAIENAPVVDALLAAGADLQGTTVTDELAFSLAGTNVHDGTPRHPIDPERIPGGSSSGSASAVANGVVDIGIGTDTGGSIRVPASYCGIYGLRTTHGRVSKDGVVPLAPSFDVVGLLARQIDVLAAAAGAVLDGAAGSWRPTGFLLADDLLALADPDVIEPFVRATAALAARAGLPLERGAVFERGELDDALLAFRTRQLREAWRSHGDWITEARPRFGLGVAARFDAASKVTDDDVEALASVPARIARRLSTVLDAGYVIVQPAAAGVAPKIERRDTDDTDRPTAFDPSAQGRGDDLRRRILTLTSPAGLAGLPVLVLPLVEVGGLPVGIALVGAAGGDEALLSLAIDAV